MSCIIDDIHKLMNEYGLKGISFIGNVDENNHLQIDEFGCIHIDENRDDFVAHKPDQEEYENMFIQEGVL